MKSTAEGAPAMTKRKITIYGYWYHLVTDKLEDCQRAAILAAGGGGR